MWSAALKRAMQGWRWPASWNTKFCSKTTGAVSLKSLKLSTREPIAKVWVKDGPKAELQGRESVSQRQLLFSMTHLNQGCCLKECSKIVGTRSLEASQKFLVFERSISELFDVNLIDWPYLKFGILLWCCLALSRQSWFPGSVTEMGREFCVYENLLHLNMGFQFFHI